MKAWILSDITGYYEYQELVFADTQAQAKTHGFDNISNMVDWVNIRCIRCKPLDNCEHLSKHEQMLKLIMDCGWRYEYEGQYYDETNVEQLRQIINL